CAAIRRRNGVFAVAGRRTTTAGTTTAATTTAGAAAGGAASTATAKSLLRAARDPAPGVRPHRQRYLPRRPAPQVRGERSRPAERTRSSGGQCPARRLRTRQLPRSVQRAA